VPDSLAPFNAETFTLVVLAIRDRDHRRVVRAIQRVAGNSADEADLLTGQPFPFALKTGLSHADALVGQFELISADAASAFVRDEVFRSAPRAYLDGLFGDLLEGPEFQQVEVRVQSVPPSEEGLRFIDQFLGDDPSWRSGVLFLMHKKARIMQRWAAKIGGLVACPNNAALDAARETSIGAQQPD
jgi:hypothetical protein